MPAFQAKKLVKGVSDETEVSDLQSTLAGRSRESASLTLTGMAVVGRPINRLKSRLWSNKTPSTMAAWLLQSSVARKSSRSCGPDWCDTSATRSAKIYAASLASS